MEGRVYRANMALVAFNSLHLWGVRQSCSCSQILFVLNLIWMGNENSLGINRLICVAGGEQIQETVQIHKSRDSLDTSTNKQVSQHKLEVFRQVTNCPGLVA